MSIKFKYTVKIEGTLDCKEKDVQGAKEAYQELLDKYKAGEEIGGWGHFALESNSHEEFIIRCLQAGIKEGLTEELTSEEEMTLQLVDVVVVLDK